MTAILESAPAKRVAIKTRENWQAYRAYSQREPQPNEAEPSPGLEELASRCIEHVQDWKRLAELVHTLDAKDEIDDALQVGNSIYPIASSSADLLQRVCRMVDRMPSGLPQADLRISAYEMEQVSRYFQSWPRSNSERVQAIREEFAKGQDRDFKDFASDTQVNPAG